MRRIKVSKTNWNNKIGSWEAHAKVYRCHDFDVKFTQHKETCFIIVSLMFLCQLSHCNKRKGKLPSKVERNLWVPLNLNSVHTPLGLVWIIQLTFKVSDNLCKSFLQSFCTATSSRGSRWRLFFWNFLSTTQCLKISRKVACGQTVIPYTQTGQF